MMKWLSSFCFWARVSEGIVAILLIDQLPEFESFCFFMSRSCWAAAFSLLYHLFWFVFPINNTLLPTSLRGLLTLVKNTTQIISPLPSCIFLAGIWIGSLTTYYTWFGGCPVLKNLIWLLTFPIFLFFLGWRRGESGKCKIFSEKTPSSEK